MTNKESQCVQSTLAGASRTWCVVCEPKRPTALSLTSCHLSFPLSHLFSSPFCSSIFSPLTIRPLLSPFLLYLFALSSHLLPSFYFILLFYFSSPLLFSLSLFSSSLLFLSLLAPAFFSSASFPLPSCLLLSPSFLCLSSFYIFSSCMSRLQRSTNLDREIVCCSVYWKEEFAPIRMSIQSHMYCVWR